ncbi:hypothetical protein BpHYR1_042937 [Brachionus plicatilis]|uniref:Uncharacterized protein n=1 Tax=Brachionus plicatilis TaxID=10195 RepID=A0A3M7P495_BRAPC|nr:hypothetical protein BpHYR1_042937 [Brachionus plicatilis]
MPEKNTKIKKNIIILGKRTGLTIVNKYQYLAFHQYLNLGKTLSFSSSKAHDLNYYIEKIFTSDILFCALLEKLLASDFRIVTSRLSTR